MPFVTCANKIALIMGGNTTVSKGNDVEINYYIREYDEVAETYEVFSRRHIQDLYQNGDPINLVLPIPISPKTDIDVRGISSGPGASTSVSYTIFLVDA